MEVSQVCCDASPSCCTSCRGREGLLPRTNRTHITPKSPTLAWKTRGRKSLLAVARNSPAFYSSLARSSPATMGRGMGAVNFPYPKWVWSPAGGFWCNPPNWKRNTAIVAAVWGAALYFTFKWSSANERCYLPPVDYPIPSQFWRKHAVEDDPRLKDMGWEQATNTPAGTKC